MNRLFSFQNTSKILVGFLTSINKYSCDIGLTNKSLLDILKEHLLSPRRRNMDYIYRWLSSSQNKPILKPWVEQGFEFEIKTDKKKGLCTLPPSTHRDNKLVSLWTN